MQLSNDEIDFLRRTLHYGEQNYEDRAPKYIDIDGYYRDVYLPTKDMFKTIRTKLTEEKKGNNGN